MHRPVVTECSRFRFIGRSRRHRRRGRLVTGAFALMALLLIGAIGQARADSIVSNGTRYDYTIYPARDPVAIWIVYHGFGGTGQAMAKATRFHARGAPIVVVYPTGQWMTWDSTPSSPDVAFTKALISKLRKVYGQLPVYAAGISAGASMVWRASVEADIDCAVPVAGNLSDHQTTTVKNRPYLLAIHGTADKIVPINGGTGPFGAPINPAKRNVSFVNGRGGNADLEAVQGGTHAWDMGKGRDTTGEALSFCGVE